MSLTDSIQIREGTVMRVKVGQSIEPDNRI